jgi:FlaA1/EpsC-like NDP-sugar epimerase
MKSGAVTKRDRAFLMLGDLTLIWVGLLTAILLRTEFNWARSLEYLNQQTWFFFGLSLSTVLIFHVRGLYHRAWRYVGIGDALDLLVALAISLVPFQLIALSANGIAFPRSGLALAFFPIFFLLSGFRLAVRVGSESRGRQRDGLRYLVVGWNDAAEIAVRELQRSGGEPVGLVSVHGRGHHPSIRGCPYLGSLDDINDLVTDRAIHGLVLAGLTPAENSKVMAKVGGLKLELRTLPPVSELLKGQLQVATLRPLQLEDLLEREPVRLDPVKVSDYLRGERVLVTGAGGSIGSEIVRQCLRAGPELVVLFGRGENSIHEVSIEVRAILAAALSDPANEVTCIPRVVPYVGNVGDPRALTAVFNTYRPTVVFHAAAHKHVPLMEHQVVEACLNNIFGTLNLMKFCQQHQVKKLVALSTDKAVSPSSVMGATKRVTELLLHTSRTPGFAAVRFGNVLGSRGSVIPTMQAQIAKGGPVTVTSPDMERYFMTIPEAVSLVLGAGAMASGGEIYVLEMGRPVRIMDLAENLIRLSGMVPAEDIEIAITGVRPGEKLSEVLVDEGETSTPSGWEGIVRVDPTRLSPAWPGDGLEVLRVAVERGDEEAARRALFALLKAEMSV